MMRSLNRSGRRRERWTAIGLAASSLILCFELSASADSHGGWKTTGWLGYEGQGDTDIEVAGDFEFWMVSGGLKSAKMVNDSLVVTLQGDYRAVGYDFVGSDDPLDTIHVFRFNPMLTYMLNDKWSLTGGPSFQLSAESGADAGDAVTGGGSAGVGYKWSDNLAIALGVVVTTQIEDDARVQPFVVINWGITESLSLGMEARNSRGGEAQLSYALGDHWELGIGAGFRRERFRLDDAGLIKDGVGEEESTVVNLRVAYKVSETFTIEGYGGTTVDGELRIENKDGDKIGKSDYDNAGYGGVRLKFGF